MSGCFFFLKHGVEVGKFIFKNRMYTLNNKVISLVWNVTYPVSPRI